MHPKKIFFIKKLSLKNQIHPTRLNYVDKSRLRIIKLMGPPKTIGVLYCNKGVRSFV